MPIQLPTPRPRLRIRRWSGPQFTAAMLLLAGAATAGTSIMALPAPLVLPAIGVLATLGAMAMALIAWSAAKQIGEALTYWDIAGALTLIGVFATLLSEPELALPLLDNQRTQ